MSHFSVAEDIYLLHVSGFSQNILHPSPHDGLYRMKIARTIQPSIHLPNQYCATLRATTNEALSWIIVVPNVRY